MYLYIFRKHSITPSHTKSHKRWTRSEDTACFLAVAKSKILILHKQQQQKQKLQHHNNNNNNIVREEEIKITNIS